MSRSYKRTRLKKHRVYSVRELMSKFGVVSNTVSNWVRTGLKPSDRSKPYLFRGAVVNEFHEERRKRSKVSLRPGEFKCLSCKNAVFPYPIAQATYKSRSGALLLFAKCPECGARITKLGKASDLDTGLVAGDPNTSGSFLHEDEHRSSSGFGICTSICRSKNDRIIYSWQNFAGKFDEKTIDRHLSAIRFMEVALEGKRFDKLTIEDVCKVRERLKGMLDANSPELKSRSTVSHMASHMRAFLQWLLKQNIAIHLPRDLADYIQLPKSVYSGTLNRTAKSYPTIDEAESMLQSMPAHSIGQKRDRAIFAIAFLGALRADTLISLRLEHVDVEARRIIQDGTVSRSKNGKSLEIAWFPIPDAFQSEVVSWVALLEELGFEPRDSLFPSLQILGDANRIYQPRKLRVLPMESKHAVTKAFAAASRNNVNVYTPHSAKHTIAAERDRLRLNAEQRKAWSQNMGHESEQITDRHYGKLSQERCLEVLDVIGEGEGADDILETLSDAELGALLKEAILRKRT